MRNAFETIAATLSMSEELADLRTKLAAVNVHIAELEAERETWHAWAKQVRKFFATYVSGPKIDKLLAAAPDATVANAGTAASDDITTE